MVSPVSSVTSVPGSSGRDKKQLLLVGVVAVIIVLAVIALYALAPSTASSPAASAPAPSSAAPSSAAKASPQAAAVAVPAGSQNAVDFSIDAGAQEKCGLTCRQLSPTVTNTGTATAHNVCFTVDLHNSKGELIALNGAPSIKKCIGDMAAGESKSEPLKIEADCGFLASKCVSQTLILKTQATCDETTVQFPDTVIAV